MSDNDSNSGAEEEYIVENIIDKRIVKGKVEYKIKWEGYDMTENTWEPEENLTCPALIKEFEEKWKIKEAKLKSKEKEKPTSKKSLSNAESSEENSKDSSSVTKKRKEKDLGSENSETREKKKKDNTPKGFGKNLEPETILGASDSSGELMLLMKWKGVDEADLVPAKEANVKCPQIVIKFYEERLTWNSSGRSG